MNAVIYVDVRTWTHGVNVSQCIGLVPTVTQSHTGLHGRPIENSTYELAKLNILVFTIFCF